MVVTMKVADVTFGGTGADNPVPWSRDLFDFDSQQQTYQYQEQNVIAYNADAGKDLQVTALLQLNAQGYPMVAPNDPVYLPCPHWCD